jgi:hypothetical protein
VRGSTLMPANHGLRVRALAWKRRTGPEIGAHQHRLQNAHCWTGRGHTLIAPRRHRRERERRSEQSLRQSIHFGYIIQRVAPNHIRIALIGREYLGARQVRSFRRRQAEVTCGGLEPMSRHIARREVVATHMIERIDQLPSSQTESAAPPPPVRNTLLVASQKRRTFRASHLQWHPQHLRALVEER